ncbi:MAG: hypothetical protein KDD77_15045, partial [Caldilineaceae bacterium]|nr:hypothetical protein [Caldilineaceae bacterium]
MIADGAVAVCLSKRTGSTAPLKLQSEAAIAEQVHDFDSDVGGSFKRVRQVLARFRGFEIAARDGVTTLEQPLRID